MAAHAPAAPNPMMTTSVSWCHSLTASAGKGRWREISVTFNPSSFAVVAAKICTAADPDRHSFLNLREKSRAAARNMSRQASETTSNGSRGANHLETLQLQRHSCKKVDAFVKYVVTRYANRQLKSFLTCVMGDFKPAICVNRQCADGSRVLAGKSTASLSDATQGLGHRATSQTLHFTDVHT